MNNVISIIFIIISNNTLINPLKLLPTSVFLQCILSYLLIYRILTFSYICTVNFIHYSAVYFVVFQFKKFISIICNSTFFNFCTNPSKGRINLSVFFQFFSFLFQYFQFFFGTLVLYLVLISNTFLYRVQQNFFHTLFLFRYLSKVNLKN